MLVHYWTINDEDDMTALMEIGADGLMTDYPSVLKKLTQDQ
jgi:glycerophosphoryl diester phosphodiesterase